MSVNSSPNKEVNESLFGLQPVLLRWVAVIAASLIILPLLPALVSNLVYSFSGQAPKVYWYLSRSAGFVAFTILWISMALGLGITNKVARLWPGAPTAFALHEYASLLGLAFAIYHGLVLMGDHYVDFSLPRLLAPFSIEHKPLWVGLGQVSFYIWAISVSSFYVRRWIGQKTWRYIHYINFVTYSLALFHGIFSGTDSNVSWVRWYYWISGLSLLALLLHRIYDSLLKNKISLPKFAPAPPVQESPEATSKSPTRPSISTRLRNLPLALLRAQAKKPVAATQENGNEHVPEPVSIQTNSHDSMQTPTVERVQQAVDGTTEQQLPAPAPAPVDVPVSVNEVQASEIKKMVDGPVVRLVGTYKGKQIDVRIFGEPTTKPIPESKESEDEIKLPEKTTLFIRLKDRFKRMTIEPTSPKRQPERISFSQD